MTIGFGHKDREWKARYSFTPTTMIGVDKHLVSQKNGAMHKHNVGANNSFYGTVNNSAISVAFNDNLSANKIFKTISVEGTDTLKGAEYKFYPYKASDPSVYYYPDNLEPLMNKGGMLYGKVGKNQDLVHGATMFYVGKILNADQISKYSQYIPADYVEEFPVDSPLLGGVLVDSNGSDFIPEPGVRYAIFDSQSSTFYFTLTAAPNPALGAPKALSDLQQYSDISGIAATITLPVAIPWISSLSFETDRGNRVVPYFSSNQYDVTSWAKDNAVGSDRYYLYAFKNPDIHGTDLRGQRAEMSINLGSSDFELYGINLNYEMVNGDHTK